MNRKAIRAAFLVLIALLPIQYALVGLLSMNGDEPWPAVVLPGFKNVWDDGASIRIPAANFSVRFEGGGTEIVEPGRILSVIPASHHLAVMRNQYCPASLSGSTQTERGLFPESRQWLTERLGGLFPDRTPVHVDVAWYQLEYRRGVQSTRTVPLDTLKIALR